MKKEIFVLIVLPVFSLLWCCLLKSPRALGQNSILHPKLDPLALQLCSCVYIQNRSQDECTEAVKKTQSHLGVGADGKAQTATVSLFSWTSKAHYEKSECILTQD